MSRTYGVLVIGSGPAGIAAACCAAESGLRVGLLDDNPAPGGQIWRGERGTSENRLAHNWYRRLRRSPVEVLCGWRVFAHPGPGVLQAEGSRGDVAEFGFSSLILATGARERFLPFPGWTLPNVMGAGGLQAMVKSGLPIAGKRVVVAGTGPLLLAVAAHLAEFGAKVLLVAEQASLAQLVRFAVGLVQFGGKILEGVEFRRKLGATPYLTGCWVTEAAGTGKLERVTLRRAERQWTVDCDYLACGFHLVPNTELAALLGCAVHEGCVTVDDQQRTSIPGAYCAGEPTGIAGVDSALVQGAIAGYCASGQEDKARELMIDRDRLKKFAARLNRACALDPRLRELATPETIVCRCEDVSLARIRQHDGWRAAKLHSRCGMGPCQGRICGAALNFLLGWEADSVRPPLFPVHLKSLLKDGRPHSCNGRA